MMSSWVSRRRRGEAARLNSGGEVALVIAVLDAEGTVEDGLVGVGGGADEVVEGGAGEEVIFGAGLMVEAEGELVGGGGDLGGGGVGVETVGALRIVGERVAGEGFGDAGVYGDDERVAGEGGGVDAGTLFGGGDGEDLGGAEDLAEGLELDEVEGAVATVVEVRDGDGAAVGEAELVAAEGRDAAGADGGGVVEVVAGVEGGVAEELEEGAVDAVGAGAGGDVGIAGGAAADLGGHPAGEGVDGLDGVDVEVGEGGAAHLGVADLCAVEGEGGFDAALAVDGELRGEVGAVRVCAGADVEQEKGGEVTLVEGDFADGGA